jgi:hypothetical protein
MSSKWFDKNWGSLFSSLSLVTSLAEALDWDQELADKLFKCWSIHYINLFNYEKQTAILLLTSYLPEDKAHLEESLTNWLQMNFNPPSEKTDQEIH